MEPRLSAAIGGPTAKMAGKAKKSVALMSLSSSFIAYACARLSAQTKAIPTFFIIYKSRTRRAKAECPKKRE